ncbi:MAG: DUF2189 domain-containing protein [Hydrogenophilales bacterium]|jgi:uncharacterized membrane protein|nr:DUF2189 domain-containing protein [Hydrogenophilales bacterium]
MSTLSVKPRVSGMAIPAIRQVEVARSLAWLRLGWGDFRRSWPVSLSYGVLFSALGWSLMAWARDSAHLTMTLISGFALVAPFLAIGFYAISSRLEHGLDAGGPLQALTSLRRNAASIGLFALMLAFMLSAWERVSALLVGLFLRNDLIVSGYFSLLLLFDADHLGFVIAYLALGAILAGLVFALAAVSLPMMMDRPVDVVTAVVTSLCTVWHNPLPMLVWAAIITVLTLAGAMTAFIGLAVLFPLLGHATWHAYRDLVASG